MSFQIDRGLFLLDFVDHHAVLGVPIDADAAAIRKRYLRIARRLHPDSCVSESEEGKQRASEFLSKLVNPSWEKLSQEKERIEYDLVLKLKGQQAASQGSLNLGNLAKELAAASNPDHFYRSSLKDLVDRQYDQLDHILDITGQISELNLVYLMRKGGNVTAAVTEPKKKIYTGSNLPDSSQAPGQPMPMARAQTAPARRETVADQYYRRAEEHTAKNNFAQAVLELRDALKLEPNNSRCHALMGVVYLRQNQATMAKIHLNRALELDPQNERALVAKQQLEQAQTAGKQAASNGAKATGQKTAGQQGAGQKGAGQKPAPKPASKPNKPDAGSGGGLFGLFGGKKK
jgi:curved DNA-binding protein CbpA